MSDSKLKDVFNNLEHIIIRVLLIVLLVVSCIKLLLIELAGFTH